MRRGVASHGRTVQTDVLHAWEARARGQSLSSRGSMYEPLYFSSNYHQKWPRTTIRHGFRIICHLSLRSMAALGMVKETPVFWVPESDSPDHLVRLEEEALWGA